MEKSKSRPVSNTVMFSSIFVSVCVCFVALIHVEIELHAHRQMLQALNQQRQENVEPQNTAHDETTADSSLKRFLHGDSAENGEYSVAFKKINILLLTQGRIAGRITDI